MAEEKLLTIRDVALILGISEREVVDLAEKGKIPAYKVAGVYLRFKREQIEEFQKSLKQIRRPTIIPEKVSSEKTPFRDRVSDFFYFNDFYILAIIIILLMLYIIFWVY